MSSLNRRFFIAGCQRSGTTLMRLILESHQDIACFDEQYSYEILSGRRAPPEPMAGVVGFKIPVWSEQLLHAELHWNEYAFLYDSAKVPNFYDREPLIFMIRGSLDTVASMMKLKVGSDSWLQRVAVPVIHGMADSARLSEEFRADLTFALSCADPEVAIGALYWKIKSSAVLSYIDAGLPVHVVSYEQFVEDPAAFLPGILQHVGVQWDEDVLRTIKCRTARSLTAKRSAAPIPRVPSIPARSGTRALASRRARSNWSRKSQEISRTGSP